MNRRLGFAVVLFPALAFPIIAQDVQPPAPIGSLVDIGGYRLHLWCMGEEKAAPSVVFLPGDGDFSFTWGLVLPEVAHFTRACSYDKAFEAWSDRGPLPRTHKQDAYELRLLLTRGGVKGPYVLVGASAGGPLARIFAREFPADVSGMVLVDATDADTVMGRVMDDGKIVDYRVRLESKGRPIPPIQTTQSSPPGPLTAEEQARFERYQGRTITKSYSPHDRLPADLQALDVWFRNHRNPLIVKADYPFHAEEMQQLFEEQQRSEPPFGEKPLIVLVADDKPRTVAGQRKQAEQANPVFVEKTMQKVAQATLSKNGQYVRLASGHEIHLYRPAWVIEAVRQVVDACRIQARR